MFERDHNGVYRLNDWWIYPDIGARTFADQQNPARVRQWVAGRGEDYDNERKFKLLADAKTYVLSQQ
jgi:hypothetical protein